MEWIGILPLLKPKGLTSHDCVFKLRKLLRTKKIGHTGTLDPDVTGVLPICIGRATKVVDYMHEYPKSYVGEVTIGFSTTTEDSSGEVVEKQTVAEEITEKQVRQILSKFKGNIKQIPPMYSAVKVNGKKLYEYARANQTVERPVREVTIYEITLLDIPKRNEDHTISFSFEVYCSKGTYIRTLAVDIGKELGYPAHMSFLKRTKSGPFTEEQCLTFDDIEKYLEDGLLSDHLFPIEKAIEHIPKITVTDEIEMKVRNGSVLPEFTNIDGNRFTLYNKEGQSLAIYIKHPTKKGLIKPEKMLTIN